jgi:phosphinothricin acetyltransferase
MGTCNIRLATESDLYAINEIYNLYVARSTCTYQTEPETIEDRFKWFAAHGGRHPVTVAERDGVVVGWGSLSPFHRRAAYRNSVENSIYVRHDLHKQGIGSALLEDLISRARTIGHHTIIALIDASQQGSIVLHHRFHFAKVAHLKEVGNKFDRWLDVVYMQLIL